MIKTPRERQQPKLSPGEVSRQLYGPAPSAPKYGPATASGDGQPAAEVSASGDRHEFEPVPSATAEHITYELEEPRPITYETTIRTRHKYGRWERQDIAAVADSIKGDFPIRLSLEREGNSIKKTQHRRITKADIKAYYNSRSGSMDEVRAELSRMCDEVEREMNQAKIRGIQRPSKLR